jgi:hypothetical protein
MYRHADPLALDPLGPIGIGPIAAFSAAGPLGLDPLSPITTIGEGHDSRTWHTPLPEQAHAGAKVTT